MLGTGRVVAVIALIGLMTAHVFLSSIIPGWLVVSLYWHRRCRGTTATTLLVDRQVIVLNRYQLTAISHLIDFVREHRHVCLRIPRLGDGMGLRTADTHVHGGIYFSF